MHRRTAGEGAFQEMAQEIVGRIWQAANFVQCISFSSDALFAKSNN